MKFTCIGFNVRKWPWNGEFNVDETGWEQNEEGYSALIREFGLKENEYQLLEIQTQEKLFNVSKYINNYDGYNLVGIEFPYEIVKLQDSRFGYNTASINIDLSSFICRGFDVCDFNGLFSALHNRQFGRDNCRLFPESQLFEALEFAQIVNVFDREHSPNVVAKVYSLK